MAMHNVLHIMHDLPLLPHNLTMAGRTAIRRGRDVPLHQHPMIELVYYLEGDVQCRIGSEVVGCRPGTLRVMPAGVLHGELSHTDWACFYIGLDVPACPPWPQHYVDDSYGTMSGLCGTIGREWNGQAADRDTMLTLLLRQLDLLLRRAHDQQDVAPAERLVREAERLLRERFAAPVTTSAIAASLGVSSSYLRAQFARLRGQTPIAYLHALRAQHALALIRNSTLSLEAIAKLSGYDSSSHLSRHIKRVTGSRPGTFRGAPIEASEISAKSKERMYRA